MEDLREKIPIILAIMIAIVICGIAIYFIEFHQSIYYTQIDNSKIEKTATSDDMKYEYTLACYNKNGNRKEIKFKTSRELRESAYLKLEVIVSGVHSWEEIPYNELPDKVKANYTE